MIVECEDESTVKEIYQISLTSVILNLSSLVKKGLCMTSSLTSCLKQDYPQTLD